MTIPTGNNRSLNRLKGISTAFTVSADDIARINTVLPKGTIVVNSDTHEVKIADGVSQISALTDHSHPNTYSSLVHTHMFGTNQPWLISNPKLWYRDDLVNHPELIVLDGSEISPDRATDLARVFPGSKLITTPLEHLSGSSFENDHVSLVADSYTGSYLPSNLFGDELSISNFSKVLDQWMTSSTNLESTHTLTVTIKGGFTYRPTEYWVIPAAGTGTNVLATRPTPRDWTFEGSNDNETWTALDTHTDVESSTWEACTVRTFSINTLENYAYFRLQITKWNAGETGAEEIGLRRFWIFGRKNGVFSLPNIESPDPDFVYVVPTSNINTGLKHEDIGDIGNTGIAPNLLPQYRLPTDGSTVTIAAYENLYAVIGHNFDPQLTLPTNRSSGTSLARSEAVWYEYDLATPSMLSSYQLTATDSVPTSWIVEGKLADGSYVALQSITDLSEANFNAVNGKFSLDTNATEQNYVAIRINVLSWGEGATYEVSSTTIWGHGAGEFYLPNISLSGVTTYIVAENQADDVAADIIQRLQANIVTLTTALATLQNQVNSLDPNIQE